MLAEAKPSRITLGLAIGGPAAHYLVPRGTKASLEGRLFARCTLWQSLIPKSVSLFVRRMASTEAKQRKQTHCSFCGKDQTQVRKMIAGPSVYICDACVNVCKTIIDRQDTFHPAGMTLTQFKIGEEFLTASGRWVCTDIGTRTVIAKHVADRGGRTMVEPLEIVFDETQFDGCSPVPAAAVSGAEASRRKAHRSGLHARPKRNSS